MIDTDDKIETAIREAAERVLEACREHGLKIATAESCTGGLVIAALTDIAGSSDVVECGFVTYSNTAKQEMLGVRADTLMRHGAVSRATAEEMAHGALMRARTNLAVAVTGIAGPGGGSKEKPVGLVHFAAAQEGRSLSHHEERFSKRMGRLEIRRQSVLIALRMLEGMTRRQIYPLARP